ncbi:MAG: four helix bundle protein [Labilibaculum sp.]|nr:four helix bundle protein [Labilibaculum sp.]MBI9057966.1 four helix bundle protein [Labilibaculum sp.]
MKNFRKLNIWQNGITIVKMTYRLADMLPNDEKYGLRSQICRAAVSVPSNIAEGSRKIVMLILDVFLILLWDLCSNWKLN